MTEEKKKRGRPRKDTSDQEPDVETTQAEEKEETGTSEPVLIPENQPVPKGLNKSLEKLVGKLNKASGGTMLRVGVDARHTHDRFPSGVLELDLKLRGGWPVGGLNVLYGPQSSGKSLLVLKTIASVQKFCRLCHCPFTAEVACDCGKNEGGQVLYVDAERSWTNEWSEKFGIDLSRLLIATPENMEEAFNTIDIVIKESALDLVILDSVAALVPKTEGESTMEEWQTGLVPRLYTKFLRKWSGDIAKIEKRGGRSTAVIFINQIRKKVGAPAWSNPEIMPGGDAQYFFGTDIIRVSKKGIEMSDDKKDPRPLYQTIRFVVEKSKASAVKLEGLFNVAIHKYMDKDGVIKNVGDVDNAKTLIDYARKFDVLKAAPLVFRGKEYKTLDEVEKDMKNNVALQWALFKPVVAAYADYVPSLSVGDRDEEE